MRTLTRRSLVLTTESAGHWFRRSLPPHVFFVMSEGDTAAENEEAAQNWRLSGGDWKNFLSTYCASFVAVSLFIA